MSCSGREGSRARSSSNAGTSNDPIANTNGCQLEHAPPGKGLQLTKSSPVRWVRGTVRRQSLRGSAGGQRRSSQLTPDPLGGAKRGVAFVEAFETLRSLSEVAVALAGFTGIVAVLGNRAGGRWGPLEWLRLRMLLEASLGVLFLSLIPGLLHELGALRDAIWRVANGLQAVAHAAGICLLYLRFRKLEPSQWPPEERWLTVALLPVSIAIVLLQASVALGSLDTYGFFLYLLGLIYLLGIAALHFVLLLVPDAD